MTNVKNYKIEPGADLCYADLCDADLRDADLHGADLRWADLRDIDLRAVDLHGADLHGADLRGANLRGANLTGADLTAADLSCASIRYCTGNGKEIKNADCADYHVVFTMDVMSIGRNQYTTFAWLHFTDAEILDMNDGVTLEWWRTWKPRLIDPCAV